MSLTRTYASSFRANGRSCHLSLMAEGGLSLFCSADRPPLFEIAAFPPFLSNKYYYLRFRIIFLGQQLNFLVLPLEDVYFKKIVKGKFNPKTLSINNLVQVSVTPFGREPLYA